ncbi:HNH endonuclease [Rhizobium giardinii]|uniref:HNH endonuclease n=1 Tax=Rhizobium giardinii TaxID=56731 RepID=UPI003D6DE940
MWETDPKSFSARFGLTDRAASLFRCTAEHLVARSDGGRDTEENIVAACHYCNRTRHRPKRPKDAASYACFVQSKIEKGRWPPVRLTHQTCETDTLR